MINDSGNKSHNADVRRFLMRYCGSESAPNYAVLLKGPWGSGKTWFVKSLMADLSTPKRVLYATLFGVKNVGDITDQFFTQLHPKLGSPAAQSAWKLVKQVAKGTMRIDFNGDGEVDGNLQIGVPEFEKWSGQSGAILIFDDLERSSMDIGDLLGYINEFVEHGGYRAIIVANEEQVVSNNPGFVTIKEKLIGKSLEVFPVFEEALKHFFDEIAADGACHQLICRKEIILKIFERAKYNNLRQLRQAIFDFADFWSVLESFWPVYFWTDLWKMCFR